MQRASNYQEQWMCDNPFHFIRYCLIFFGSGSEELVSSRGASRISQSRIFSISVNGLTWIQQTRWIVTPTVSCTNWKGGVWWSKDIHIPGSSIYQMQCLSKEPSIFCEMHTCMLNKRQGYHFFRIAGKLLLSALIQLRMNQLKTTGPCRMKWNETR